MKWLRIRTTLIIVLATTIPGLVSFPASAQSVVTTSPLTPSSTPSNGNNLIWVLDPKHPQSLPNKSLGTASTTATAAAVWGACAASTPATKEVTQFPRRAVFSRQGKPLAAGTSELFCGNSSYGYNHIYLNHRTEWEQKASLTNQNWRDVADLSMREGLINPNAVTYDAARNTFCFSRLIYLYRTNDNAIVGTMNPRTIVAGQDGKVITAFPSSTGC